MEVTPDMGRNTGLEINYLSFLNSEFCPCITQCPKLPPITLLVTQAVQIFRLSCLDGGGGGNAPKHNSIGFTSAMQMHVEQLSL